jgi:hypothetical protein
MAYLVVVMVYDFALISVPAESDPIPSPDPSSLAHDLEQSPLVARHRDYDELASGL